MRKHIVSLVVLVLVLVHCSIAQPHGWQLLDKTKDGYYGISLSQAMQFLQSKHKKPKQVIVAVIDSGIDTAHADLKELLWVNKKETPGDGIDNDNDGYVDDVHGWNFLGGRDGRNVGKDSHEEERIYHTYKKRFSSMAEADTVNLSAAEKQEYKDWARAKRQIEKDAPVASRLNGLRSTYLSAVAGDSIIRLAIKKDEYSGYELDSFNTDGATATKAKHGLLDLLQANKMMDAHNQDFLKGFNEYLVSQESKLTAMQQSPPAYRIDITKDDENNLDDHNYGNTDLFAGDPFHGTHVSGIIKSVAGNNVRIMVLRVVPNGDEHDKDIALAIRYAADHGASIINMSFGKGYSPHKDWVDAAVAYAAKKNVLLVHAAGNSNENNDTTFNFPNAVYINKERAPNWIEVGASGDTMMGGIKANFSNYGINMVDVFAPGVKIWSTVPHNNQYGIADGTSMACPMVVGLATLLKAYYPKLKAKQLKQIIEQSVVVPTNKDLSKYSRTGGIVNAYQAVKLAAGE